MQPSLPKNVKYVIGASGGPERPPLTRQAEGDMCVIKGLAMCIKKCYEKDIELYHEGAWRTDNSAKWRARVAFYRTVYSELDNKPKLVLVWDLETASYKDVSEATLALACDMQDIWKKECRSKSRAAAPAAKVSTKKKRR